VLFVTTTNFIDAIDDAFLSRADLVMHFALPSVGTIANILQHSLEELAVQWPALRSLYERRTEIEAIAKLCEGWNGRQVRKLVLAALAQRLEVAKEPAKLTLDDLREAARKRGGVEWAGDAAPPARELVGDVPAELKHDHDHDHDHGHGGDHDHHHPKTRRIP
jgi:SpoVK/Ycf46/Vps4 family AAA+-type ATPase